MPNKKTTIGPFSLDDKETAAAQSFITRHKCTSTKMERLFSYKFTPTGIGNCILLSCSCGASRDVTNSASW